MSRRTVGAGLALMWAVAPAWGARFAVEGQRGMVVSSHALASEAGAEVLRQGGNAVDAAVAVATVLAVVYPRAGNLGGGGFLLVHQADGSTAFIDYRETAPARATRDLYLGPDGQLRPEASLVGHLAAGVPGTVAGLALARDRFGSRSWGELLEPARRLAAEGFPATPGLVRDLREYGDLLRRFPESARVYLPGGRVPAVGERFLQTDLAATLARLQRDGPREFYEGETARRIATEMERGGGLITLDDLRGYRPVVRQPLRGSYRGHTILTAPPPSSGGIALLQMMAMLEPHDLGRLGAASAARLHLLTEAMRRAFRDRAEYLGDADFVPVPVAGLIDPDYARSRLADIDPERATSSLNLAPGRPAGAPAGGVGPQPARRPEADETTHFSIVDAAGNVVANTYTLNGIFGNGVTVEGTGVLLNNEMDDFAAQPGRPNAFGLVQGEANAIAPGKRPLSSMTPTIVLHEGRPWIVTGSPGGPTIINTVLQVISGVVDHGMSIQQAVDAPRFHHQWLPDTLFHESYGVAEDTAALLRAKGHVLGLRGVRNYDPADQGARYIGAAESILIDPRTGLRLGASDPRAPDGAAVGH